MEGAVEWASFIAAVDTPTLSDVGFHPIEELFRRHFPLSGGGFLVFDIGNTIIAGVDVDTQFKGFSAIFIFFLIHK
jgi:hypothetical protein